MTGPSREQVESTIRRAAAFAWSDREIGRVTDAVVALLSRSAAEPPTSFRPATLPCSQCGTDAAVCKHLVAKEGLAGCCGVCSTGATHAGVAAEPPEVQP